MAYLNDQGDGATAISTIAPGPFHTPAVAALTLHNPAVMPRWFDARQSWLLPAGGGTIVIPGFTPVPEALHPYVTSAETMADLPLRPTDLDRPVTVLASSEAATLAGWSRLLDRETADGPLPVTFGEAAALIGYQPLPPAARPGETIDVVTAWRWQQPLDGAMLFAQLVGPDGFVAGSDQLGAPGESWLAGDTLLQLHSLTIPPGTPAGEYAIITGLYTQSDGRRLTVDGRGALDVVTLGTIQVSDE